MLETLTLAAVLIPCLVIAIVFHEVAHGYAAKLLGDPTASESGRLTLNPLAHVDPVGTLLVPGALALLGGPVFGWAKPVPVIKQRLSNPRFGMMAVAAAGPVSNFVLAAVGAALLGASWVNGARFDLAATGTPLLVGADGAALYWQSGLYFFILINLFLGLFNLLPIPPFDGSHIVGGLLPRSLRPAWERLQGVGMAMIIVVVAFSWVFGTGWLVNVLGAPMEWAMGFYLGIADWVSRL
ncbi:MAG: site-2 protease family protein [Erythrobacter sp.]|jgi:Zn-dependent protease|nr:site-2 protease family protein [Erythrobacter sp.]